MKNLQAQEKVAIIGSGISGLACAYFLSDHYDIKLYEKNDYLGGHSNTAKINYNGCDIAVDTGFIVFNFATYPNLVKFFELLKVEIKKSNMSFAVKIDDSKLEYAGTSLTSLFAQKKNLFNPNFLRMIFDIVRFNKKALELLNKDCLPNYTLKNFLDDLRVKKYFQQYYLLPMASAIWSSPLDKIIDYPAQSFVNFFKNHGLLSVTNQPQWYTVAGGSCNYVEKISQKNHYFYSRPIRKIPICCFLICT
jgi:predicted NAD/FAD-binding protein